MENASKALIIAGAILLAIAIIGIAMSVFNSAREAVGNANLDEATVATFNSKFANYEGSNVRGSNVNTLLNTVRQHNLSVGDDTSKQVNVTITGGVTSGGNQGNFTKNVLKTSVKVGTGYSFNVSCNPDAGSGLITDIVITRNTGSSSSSSSSSTSGSTTGGN